MVNYSLYLFFFNSRQHGPVGATDEIINAIPHHTLTDEEFGMNRAL